MFEQNSYDQGYYYGNMSGSGLDIYNCSGHKDIMSKSIVKRSREFDSELPAEYTEYSDSCKCICYIGAIRIDQGEYNLRYDTLHHIFIPAEQTDINDPYSYIRYLLPYYYNSSKNLRSPLNRAEIPKISEIIVIPETSEPKDELLYHRLLSYCLLDGEKNRKKFAKLLELAYNIMLRNEKAAVVLPDEMFDINRNNIPNDMGNEPQNCYQFAAALMLILHLLAPDCFAKFNSQDKLRINLMHSIVKNTLYKNGLCFIEKSDALKEGNIDCPIINIYEPYDNYPKDSFYYALAQEAQISIKSMKLFLDKMCQLGGVEKFSCRQENLRFVALDNLLKTYNSYLPRRMIKEADYLITWDSYKNIVSKNEKTPENVYYREYIENLVKFNGHGQLPDDKAIQGFWKNLKSDKFRDADAAVFLLEECKTDDIFLQLINEVIGNEDICYKMSESQELHLWKIIGKISGSDGLKYLCTVTELLKNISNEQDIFYQTIKNKVIENARPLYKLLAQNADRKKWFNTMNDSELLDINELNEFVYENTVISEDIRTVKAQKNELDTRNIHDSSVLRKMLSACFQKFSQLFRLEEKSNSIENKKKVNEWKDISIELAEYFTDEQMPENFQYEISAEEKYYKKYDIQHAEHFSEMGNIPDDNELRDQWIFRLADILINCKAPEENDNLKELKEILEWNTKYGNEFETIEAYGKLKQNLETIYNHFTEAVHDTENYEYLKYADEINNDIIKEKTWNGISISDFPKIIGYFPKKPFEHIRTYLFNFYKKFANYDIYSEICEFKNKNIFLDSESLQDEIKVFMQLDNIKEMCKQYKKAMMNYYRIAELLDTDAPYRIIYNNFNGDIPPCENMTDKVYINTRQYNYMMQYPKEAEKTSTNTKQIDISLLDNNEKETFIYRMKEHIDKKSLEYENDIFDSEKTMEAFQTWNEFLNSTETVKHIITDINELKQKYTFGLFDRLMNAIFNDYNETYIEIAEQLNVDEQRKKLFEDIKNAWKEQKDKEKEKIRIDKFKCFSDIEQSLKKGEITFSDMLWKKMQSLFSYNISFHEHKAWISILSKYAGENQEAQQSLSNQRNSIQGEVSNNHFEHFWLLFADEKNYSFLLKCWQNMDCTEEMFLRLYSTLPNGYTPDEMSNDIFRMTANKNNNDICIKLFIVYVLFKNGCKNDKEYELLLGQKKWIINKYNADDETIRNRNLKSLKEVLLFTIDECTETIIKSAKNNNADLFRVCFELAGALKDEFPYIHIEMARAFEKDSEPHDKSPKRFMWNKAISLITTNGQLEPKYKHLTVLENTLKFILIECYIQQTTIDTREKFKFIRKLAFKAYSDENNTLISYEYKSKMKECWLSIIEESEDRSKGQPSKDKIIVIREIKKVLGIPNDPSSNTYEMTSVMDSIKRYQYIKNPDDQ